MCAIFHVTTESQERCKELNSTFKPDTTTISGAIPISTYIGKSYFFNNSGPPLGIRVYLSQRR